jgi:hypothetical protein
MRIEVGTVNKLSRSALAVAALAYGWPPLPDQPVELLSGPTRRSLRLAMG